MANRWLKLFRDATRNEAEIFLDGEAYFKSVVETIETAKTNQHYVYILGWMLDIGFPLIHGREDTKLIHLLSKAAGTADKPGAEIRVLVWDNLLPDYNKTLADAIRLLNKLPNTRAFADPHTFFPQFSKDFIAQLSPLIVRWIQQYGFLLPLIPPDKATPDYVLKKLGFVINSQSIGAHHEKIVIVKGEDGLVAFCGGMDLNKNRGISNDNKFPSYHDTACRLEGPAAYEILKKFKMRWHNHPGAKNYPLLGEDQTEPPENSAPHPYAQVVGTYNSLDGFDVDRSLSKAYFDIIENAREYIYIEDQYLVNIDVARALNRKLKEPSFQILFFAIQDSIEAMSDLLIPNRKRDEFGAAVLDGTSTAEKEKVLFAVIDRTYFKEERYHPGMHAKTLIVDDEIAIIGSANVNQRSFTVDSETSVVVFDDVKDRPTSHITENRFRLSSASHSLVREFRVATWKEFLRKPVNRMMYEEVSHYHNTIKSGAKRFSILIRYEEHLAEDWDVRIKNFGVVAPAVWFVGVPDANRTLYYQYALNPTMLLDALWDNVIDPKAD